MAEIIYTKTNECRGVRETLTVIKYCKGCYLASRLKKSSDWKEYSFEFCDRQDDAIHWCEEIVSVWKLQRLLGKIE